MGLSSVNYQDYCFHIQEQFLDVTTNVICETLEAMNGTSEANLLVNLYNQCDFLRKGYASSIASLVLDRCLKTNNQVQAFHLVCANSISYLLSFGNELPISYLNQMEANKYHEEVRWNWPLPVKTSNMIAVMTILQELSVGSPSCNNEVLNFTGWQGLPFGYNLP
jgi:hypothetical protein